RGGHERDGVDDPVRELRSDTTREDGAPTGHDPVHDVCELGRAACEPVRPGADVARPIAVRYEGSRMPRWPLVVCMSARSRWIRGLVGILVASCAAACTNNDTITLGAVLQLSGKLAPVGRAYRDAYQFAVDRIN